LDLQKLRQATEADHLAVEGTVPLMHEGLTTAQYVEVLQKLYGVVAAWEDRAIQIAPVWLQPALLARQRKSLLERDLAWFGATHSNVRCATLHAVDDLPSLLGAMYVMEGSTLGGQLIARHVEAALHLSEGKGDAYFRGHGSNTGPLWKEFCEMLKHRIPDEQSETVIISAKAMFSTFGKWMQGNLGSDVG
jgi:heme oxygenase